MTRALCLFFSLFCLLASAEPPLQRRGAPGPWSYFPKNETGAENSRRLFENVEEIDRRLSEEKSYRTAAMLDQYVVGDRGKVWYANETQRTRFLVTIDEYGRLMRAGKPIAAKAIGKYLYVMSASGEIYLYDARDATERGLFTHHSSAIAGQPVAAAGQINFGVGGIITKIDNHSGHYLPPPEALFQFLHRLRAAGAELTQAEIELFVPGIFHGPRVKLNLPAWERPPQAPRLKPHFWPLRVCARIWRLLFDD